MINLIGITGPARHGKNTVGDILLKHMPAASQFAYAGALKAFLNEAFEFPGDPEDNKEMSYIFLTDKPTLMTAMHNVLGPAMKQYGVLPVDAVETYLEVLRKFHGGHAELSDGRIVLVSTWRTLCQITGTEWGRETIDEMFWIDPWLPSANTIVIDVRGHGNTPTKNIEAQAIIERGGIVLKVVDPRKSLECRQHSSESGIDREYLADVIFNNGSLEDLEDKVLNFLYNHLLIGEQ